MRERLRELIGNRDFLTLALLAIVVGSVWIFIEIADEVREGELHALDVRLLHQMRNPADLADPLGPRWFEELVRDASALGGFLVLTLLGATAAAGLWLEARRAAAVWLVVAVTGAFAVSTVFKFLFARERPEILATDLLPSSFSFPSGHAFLATAVYLTVAVLLIRVVSKRRTRAFILLVALLVSGLVGFSRVYLAVHYPSDVLAGWTLGLCWAALCWLAAWRIEKL